MSKRVQGIELAAIVGRRGYAPDIIVNTETDEQVAACANPNLTALFVAAPEMYELLQQVATSTNSGYGSMMSAAALADTLRDLSSQAKQLMAKIEGGGE